MPVFNIRALVIPTVGFSLKNTTPPSPLEWNYSPSLVAAVLNALYGGGNALVVPVFNIRALVIPTVGFSLKKYYSSF